MKTNEKPTECCQSNNFFKHHHSHQNCSNPIYGLGIVGALFYFLQNATSFSLVIVGIFKAIFWPAIFMFELLSYLQM